MGRGAFPAMGKYPMAQATLSCPFGAIHLEDRRGTAQDERFALIFALPPAPHNGGRVPAGFYRITGAQNLSDFLQFNPGHFVVADFVSLASSCRTKLAHSIAPPLQRKPASLGFALGAAFGGLFGWKISAGAGPLVRLALPNQRYRSISYRRGAHCAPAEPSPFKGEGAPVLTLGRMRVTSWLGQSTGGSPKGLPYAKRKPSRPCCRGGACPSRHFSKWSVFCRRGDPCGRPPWGNRFNT